MPGRLFRDWQEFDRVMPLGDYFMIHGLATIAALMANAWRDPKKTGVFEIEQFMPGGFNLSQALEDMRAQRDPEIRDDPMHRRPDAPAGRRSQTPAHMLAFVEQLNAALGGSDKRPQAGAGDVSQETKAQE